MDFWPEKYSHFDFELPAELIATQPVSPADHARLLVVDRFRGTIHHDTFFNLINYFAAHDILFYNATRVEERRVYLRASETQAADAKRYECVFLKSDANGGWDVLMRNSRRLKEGALLYAERDTSFRFRFQRRENGISLGCEAPLSAADFAKIGEMPIPPYMRRSADAQDSKAYQNFFQGQIAQKEKIHGSAASPTAALHFTSALYNALEAKGVTFAPVCLDIGYGTFAPLTEENFVSRTLHAEHFYIPPQTLEHLMRGHNSRRIVLGTTALRALLSNARLKSHEGATQIFIEPGDSVDGVDALITNFHLPRSSLLLLVGAFCDPDLLMRAYREAIRMRYRFYSYGDAMLII